LGTSKLNCVRVGKLRTWRGMTRGDAGKRPGERWRVGTEGDLLVVFHGLQAGRKR